MKTMIKPIVTLLAVILGSAITALADDAKLPPAATKRKRPIASESEKVPLIMAAIPKR